MRCSMGCELLKAVDVYKVGHHGSRNATPKTLWNGFAHRSAEADVDHGRQARSEANKSEVRRQALVKALDGQAQLHGTQAPAIAAIWSRSRLAADAAGASGVFRCPSPC